MIPYIQPISFDVLGHKFPLFGILVYTAVMLGTWVTIQRTKILGLNPSVVLSLVLYILISAFAFSHLAVVLFYRWQTFLKDPWYIVHPLTGMSSMGGIIGAVIGFFIWKKFTKMDSAALYFECVVFAFPFGWIFGRAGCAVAHDHKGIASTLPIAVKFPDGPHLDLGLYEMVYTVGIVLFFLFIDHKYKDKVRNQPGFFSALFVMVYAPMRFTLDFFRIPELQGGDTRYLGLTFAQYACLCLIAWAVSYFLKRRRTA